jgi:hypothetical protein
MKFEWPVSTSPLRFDKSVTYSVSSPNPSSVQNVVFDYISVTLNSHTCVLRVVYLYKENPAWIRGRGYTLLFVQKVARCFYKRR